jgi:hypothetical protein
LILTIATPFFDRVIDFDFTFEQLTKLISNLPDDLAMGTAVYEKM